jgi:hypothetical protein
LRQTKPRNGAPWPSRRTREGVVEMKEAGAAKLTNALALIALSPF